MSDPVILGINNDVLEDLAGCAEHPSVTVYRTSLAQRANYEQADLDAHPCECGEDARRDWRYRMGRIDGIRFSAALPKDAAAKFEARSK